jgi:hypothetical protein
MHNPELPEDKKLSSEEKAFLNQLDASFTAFEKLLQKTVRAKPFATETFNANLTLYIKNKLIEMAAFI